MATTNHPFTETLNTRFGGVIKPGQHCPDGEGCALEVRNAALGKPWNDSPGDWIDLRSLNDGPWESDQQRTTHLTPVILAYWDWESWTLKRQQVCAQQLALLTIQRVLPLALRAAGLTDEALLCEQAADLASARSAARSAESATWSALNAHSAALSALNALNAESAESAAWSARIAESAAWSARIPRAAVLVLACTLWLEAAGA
jgi:hypothetical protein